MTETNSGSSTSKQDSAPPVKRQRRSKSFLGCYTCRRRKIACDLGKPSCLKCKKSGFVCEGYDVKLRWSQPIEFDKYGYQLPSKPNQETEYYQRRSIEYVKYSEKSAYKLYDEMDSDLATLHNMYLESPASDTVIKGHFGVFRGTKIQAKRRKRKQTNSKGSASHTDLGVGRKRSRTNSLTPNGQRRRHSKSHSANKNPPHNQLQYKSITKNQNFLYPQNVSNSIVSIPANSDPNNRSTFVGNEWLSTELLDAALLTASALNGDTHFFDMFDLEANNGTNTVTAVTPAQTNNNGKNMHNNRHNNMPNQLVTGIPTNNIIDGTIANTDMTPHNIALAQNTDPMLNSEQKPVPDLFPDNVPDQMLHLLFQGRNMVSEPINRQVPSENKATELRNNARRTSNTTTFFNSHNVSSGTPKVQGIHQNQNQQSQAQTPSSNKIPTIQTQNQSQISDNSFTNMSASSMSMTARSRYNQMSPEELASVASVDDSGITPSSIDQSVTPGSTSLTQNTGIVPTTNQNNKFKETDKPIIDNKIKIHASSAIKMPKNIMEILNNTPLPKSLAIDKFGIPTTSLNVHPMARYLLNYYIEDVADMMTVIPLAKNPWKFIYFPRAIMAIGELASLGVTSNARNGLLNALLAVSAFNLQSKFVRGSDEMKYYVDLGIQLRRQANEFVERCMEEDILSQKYKDVLVAVLSMVTIDVVWGTMSSCKIHLDHCEKIIEKKMLHKKKLSSKAIILHRIFSSLKLIQDSTSLEKIQKSEIFLNEKNYKNFLTGSKATAKQLEELNSNNFRGIFRGTRTSRGYNTNTTKFTGNSSISTTGASKIDAVSNNSGNNFDNSSKSLIAADSAPQADSVGLDNTSNSISSPVSLYSSRQNTNNSNNGVGISKRGKYNEKITDNGKVRIEFIVNNDEDDDATDDGASKPGNSKGKNTKEVNSESDIPAFVDITRTSFQPSKNKLDDRVVSSDAIYGLPNSLILMFGEIVPLTRFKKYHEDHQLPLPPFFDELAEQLEFKLLTWKLEWTLIVEDEHGSTINDSLDETKKTFISPRHEGIYHHVMSFYHALVIYFYRFIENVNPMYLLERIEKVLYHLNKIQEILENNKETSYIIPLFWQGFIAGSEAMTLYLQNGFNKWGQDIAQTGIGTYWNARQIMLEIWRRKNHNVKNNSWVDVLRDWKTNVMLT